MLTHQRDLWADFRAIYHLSPREALELPGPEYMALAYRASAYAGVMAARLASEQEDRPAVSAGVVDRSTEAQDVPLGGASAAGARLAAEGAGHPMAELFD